MIFELLKDGFFEVIALTGAATVLGPLATVATIRSSSRSALTRVGPEAIEVDRSDDPYVARFIIRRDGYGRWQPLDQCHLRGRQGGGARLEQPALRR